MVRVNDLVRLRTTKEDFRLCMDKGLDGWIEVLRRLGPGERLEAFMINADEKREGLLAHLEKLKERGLNVGTGKTKYGFLTPAPKEGAYKRYLIIYGKKGKKSKKND